MRRPWDQGKHALQVPGHGHEVPLAADMIESAEQELAESQHGLDGVFALGVELPTLQRLQAVSHEAENLSRVNRLWAAMANRFC